MEIRGAGHADRVGDGSRAHLGDQLAASRGSAIFRIRKIYTHINNTNPILDENSAERREVEKAGWEVAEDGMDFTV